MITVAEIAIAGIWSAAAVVVAGYTWEAYTGEQTAFPGIGSGSGLVNSTTPGPGQPVPSHGATVGPGGITPATGGTPLEPAGLPSGPNVKAPPLVVIAPITGALARNDKQTAIHEIQRLVDWANQKGPRRQGWNGQLIGGNLLTGTIATWVYGQPWYPKLRQLTGMNILQTA